MKSKYTKKELQITMDWFKRKYGEYIKMHVATNPEEFKEIVNSEAIQKEIIESMHSRCEKED